MSFPLRIVVWQAGFISVGRLESDGERRILHNARCIRRWNAPNGGLGEVAARGPDDGRATLDAPATEEQHEMAIVKIMHCNEDAWSSLYGA